MISRKTARSTSLSLKVEAEAAVREITISRKAFRASGDDDGDEEELEAQTSPTAWEGWMEDEGASVPLQRLRKYNMKHLIRTPYVCCRAVC